MPPREISLLSTLAALKSWPDLTDETEETHAVRAGGVLGRYRFDESLPREEWVQCSLPGHHPHTEGLVVRALCGQILKIGLKCGSKHVQGFKRVEKYVQQSVEFFENKAVVEREPRKLAEELARLEPRFTELLVLRSRVKNENLAVGNELARRLKLEGGARTEVLVEQEIAVGDGKFKQIEVPEQLGGLPFWPGDITLDRLRQALTKARSLANDVASEPTLTPANVAGFRRRFETIKRGLTGCREFVDAAAEALSEHNLGLALIAAQRSRTGRVMRFEGIDRKELDGLRAVATSFIAPLVRPTAPKSRPAARRG